MHRINQSYKLSFKIVYFSTDTAAGYFVVPDTLMLRGQETGQYYVDRTHLKVGITGRMAKDALCFVPTNYEFPTYLHYIFVTYIELFLYTVIIKFTTEVNRFTIDGALHSSEQGSLDMSYSCPCNQCNVSWIWLRHAQVAKDKTLKHKQIQ